jgi:hypothetical protein
VAAVTAQRQLHLTKQTKAQIPFFQPSRARVAAMVAQAVPQPLAAPEAVAEVQKMGRQRFPARLIRATPGEMHHRLAPALLGLAVAGVPAGLAEMARQPLVAMAALACHLPSLGRQLAVAVVVAAEPLTIPTSARQQVVAAPLFIRAMARQGA